MPLPRDRPESASQAVAGTEPMATRTTSAGRVRPSSSATPLTRPPTPLMPATPTLVSTVTPCDLVQLGDLAADGGAELADHRRGQRVDEGDVHAEAGGDGGGFGAEEAAADHDEAGAGPEAFAQRERVVDGAQQVHAGPARGRRAAAVA